MGRDPAPPLSVQVFDLQPLVLEEHTEAGLESVGQAQAGQAESQEQQGSVASGREAAGKAVSKEQGAALAGPASPACSARLSAHTHQA
jgi:hypothetical protein